MPDPSYDVAVVGGGPGGYTAAFRAADLGKQTTIVERYERLGGVCLNVGCIPSKALLHAARVVEEASYFGQRGLGFGEPTVDLERLLQWKERIVGRLTRGLDQLAKQRRVNRIVGEGRFLSPHRLEVDAPDGKRVIAFEHAIIAVGSRNVPLPGLPVDPRIMDSTGALALEDAPQRLLVIGGGVIGLELATVYHALGSRVTVVELLGELLNGCDRDLVKPLVTLAHKRYAGVHLETRVTGVEPSTEGLRVAFEGKSLPKDDAFDRILVAVGRKPNGHHVGADAAGVTVSEAGFIPVDGQQRTNVPNVFAIGDVAGEPLLAHKATHEGKVAAEVIAGKKRAFEARVIPNVAYTDPEIAWVGILEREAAKRGLEYEKGVFPWAASGRALALGAEGGLTKILTERSSGRIIGGGIAGPNAGDLISELALAIEMGCDARDVGLTIHPHPTLSETIAFAAEALDGTITDLYLPKR